MFRSWKSFIAAGPGPSLYGAGSAWGSRAGSRQGSTGGRDPSLTASAGFRWFAEAKGRGALAGSLTSRCDAPASLGPLLGSRT